MLEFAGQELRGADNRADFPRAAAEEVARFVDLNRRIGKAVRITHDRAHAHRTALQCADRQVDVAGAHNRRSGTVALHHLKRHDHLPIGERGVEQAVMEIGCDVFAGQGRSLGRHSFFPVRGAAVPFVGPGHRRPMLVSWLQACPASPLLGNRLISSVNSRAPSVRRPILPSATPLPYMASGVLLLSGYFSRTASYSRTALA